MNSVTAYIRESYNELINKVTWPSWQNLLQSTRVVLIATVIITIIVFIMDLISKQVLDVIYNM